MLTQLKNSKNWRVRRFMQWMENPIVVQTFSNDDHFVNTGGGWPLDVILFIVKWYNDDFFDWRRFEITILGFIKFNFYPSERWKIER